MNVEQLRDRYQPGTRVELIYMEDVQAPMAGTQGEVIYVDDIGTIHVKWDNGSQLGVIPTEDRIRIIN